MHAQRDDWLAELMHRVARSDRDAFAQLYRATSATLFGFVLRINRDRALAEDVLQEIYLSVWRQAAAFDRDQGQAMAWLTAIARHRAIDSMRRKAAQPVTISRFGGLEGYAGDPASHEPDLLAGLPSDTPGPLQLLDDASRAHALAHCMDRLSGEQRSSLALAYYQGLSHAEVAEHMSQPLGTVKSWVRRGLQSLRSCLDRATERLGAFGKAS
ncbi:sigma-70 family RNA polymerase sigma factor [Mitsuaria sp. GD03876]|uniref:sigma-70 family RNA polymerase sigma factor n=1 Tax=Mitsuaria sp. GD03876 TaxID=2975399 RepID=UPI002447CF94|nr:sigma-70 family RNA polymerase sigma factor [Mitsuaria sp. GD03876]MDH0864378.1 sigma-70 family RNA polymerase sigma factor [Mitsuaria sp. GD03876]